jgi:hypothetical protein
MVETLARRRDQYRSNRVGNQCMTYCVRLPILGTNSQGAGNALFLPTCQLYRLHWKNPRERMGRVMDKEFCRQGASIYERAIQAGVDPNVRRKNLELETLCWKRHLAKCKTCSDAENERRLMQSLADLSCPNRTIRAF